MWNMTSSLVCAVGLVFGTLIGSGEPANTGSHVALPQSIPDQIKRGYRELAPITLDVDGDGKPDRIVPRTFVRRSGKPGIEDHLLTFDLHLSDGRSFPAFFTFRYGDSLADYWVYALTLPVPAKKGQIGLVFYAGDDTSDVTVVLVLRGGRFVVESWVGCDSDEHCTQRSPDALPMSGARAPKKT
jgi:hypothetical protein